MATRDLYIKKTEDFKQIITEGKKHYSPHFLFYNLFKEHSLPYARLGISVPKKYTKLAVKRNKIKRVLRDIWKKRGQKGQIDLFVIVKKDITILTYDTISQEFNNKCDKILS
jgi:ribonuclease P protein component